MWAAASAGQLTGQIVDRAERELSKMQGCFFHAWNPFSFVYEELPELAGGARERERDASFACVVDFGFVLRVAQCES